jgi:hypothetical protein
VNNRQPYRELQRIHGLANNLFDVLEDFKSSHPGSYSAAICDATSDLDQLVDVLTQRVLNNTTVTAAVHGTVRIGLALGHICSVDDARGNDLLDMARSITGQLGASIQDLYGWNGRLAVATMPADVSRRTRYAVGLAVRLLPSADRARYRAEFAAELADLPGCDRAPHATRLACRTWALRRSLSGKSSVRSTRVVVVVAATSAGSAVFLADLAWPVAVLGSVLIFALMWTVSSRDRTRHLGSLIRAARGHPAPNRKR